jgi:hypothetical protein
MTVMHVHDATVSTTPRFVRDAAVALSSLVIVLGLVGMLFVPAQQSFAVSVATGQYSGTGQVVYGKVVNSGGVGMAGVRVVLYHYYRGRQHVDAAIYTAADGSFRKVLARRSGIEYVQFQKRVGKRIVRKRVHFRISPGHAYRVSARFTSRNAFVVFPVSAY